MSVTAGDADSGPHRRAAVYPAAALICALALSLPPLSAAQAAPEDTGTAGRDSAAVLQTPNYRLLLRNITYGRATLAQVRQAMTDTDVGELTNIVHALYSMRWHRGVTNLIYDMWEGRKQKYPELAWNLIDKAPVRIALASTICRMQITGTEKYLAYIRSHEHDENEFHRAQTAIALGFNGTENDVAYIKSMADGDNVYVAQSAITALALMGHKAASDALIALWHKYRNTKRGDLIQEVLRQAYNLVPHERKAGADQTGGDAAAAAKKQD